MKTPQAVRVAAVCLVVLLAMSSKGYGCVAAISVTPAGAFNFGTGGGSGTLTVNTGGTFIGSGVSCHWQLTSSPFISASPTFGGGGSTFQFQVNFTASANPNLGTRTGFITVRQNEDGTSQTITVNEAAATGNFSLAISPNSQTVSAGGSTSYAVTITRSGGFAGGVFLSASGLPTKANATFNPNNTTGNSSTMTVTTTTATPGGTFGLTVNGSNGSVIQSASTNLTVNPAPTPTPTPTPSPTPSLTLAGSSSQLSSFLDPTGATTGAPAGQAIFYRATDQHIHHIFSNTTWFTDDPSAGAGATPAISGTPVSSFLDATGATNGRVPGQDIFYVATDEHIHHLFSDTTWHTDDISGITSAPLAASQTAVISFLDATGATNGGIPGQEIFYIANDQEIHHIFSDTSWHTDNPHGFTGAPLATTGTGLSGFLDATGATNGKVPGIDVFYVASDQHIHHIFSDTTWHTDDPSAGAGAALAATNSAITSLLDATGVTNGGVPGQDIFYIGTDQHVHHLFSDTTWHTDDPLAITGGLPAASGSALCSFLDKTGATAGGVPSIGVFYIGTDQHVHHLFSTTAWHTDDATANAGAPPALVGSPLSCFVDPTGLTTGRPGGQSIYYVGTDFHVHHLYSNTTWFNDDPTAMTGAPLVSF